MNAANESAVKTPRVLEFKLSASRKEVGKNEKNEPIYKIERPSRIAKVSLVAPTVSELSAEAIQKIIEAIVTGKARAAARAANTSKDAPFAVDTAGEFLKDQPAINIGLTLTVEDLLPAEESDVSDEQREALGKSFVAFLVAAGKSENAQKNNLAVLSVRQAARLADRDPREVTALTNNLVAFRDSLAPENLETHADALAEVFARITKAGEIRGSGERDF